MSGEIEKEFVLTSKIGNGNFSTVYLAKHIQTQEIVAIKTIKNHISIAVKEAQILKKMKHPNVIKLFKFEKQKNREEALMVLEYLPENILELYEAQEYGLKEEQVKCILFQACLGLYHIHQKGIIHRDVKPENIMINRNKAEVKLIDFGLAIEQSHCITDYVATRWYRAPENLLGTKEYTVAIDIFSLGCVIVELYTGSPLFPGSNNVDQISRILAMIGEPTIHSWRKGYEMFIKLGLNFHLALDTKNKNIKNLMTSCSEGLIKIIERMLILNPSKRITAEEVLKDSYFNDIEKIVPPYVYDQYLIDIKHNKTSFVRESQHFVREPQKLEVKTEAKERVRFLSEEKGFGTFSSFKPSITSKKPENLIISKRPNEKCLNATNENYKVSYASNRDKYEGNDTKTFDIPPQIEDGFALLENKSQQNLEIHKNQENLMTQSTQFFSNDFSSKIQNSIQNYEKNLLKLSASLENMKELNNSQNFQPENSINSKILSKESGKYFSKENENYLSKEDDKYVTKENCKSSEMLSFRGFNQPKQRFQPTKESGSFFSKKNESDKQFPIKSKKVIEYLKKFQNFSVKLEEQNQTSEKPKISSFMNESMNPSEKKPKRSSFLSLEPHEKSFLANQSLKIKEKEINRFSETNIKKEQEKNGSFYQKKEFISSGNLNESHEFHPILRRNETKNNKIENLENYHFEKNSPSIEKFYRTEVNKADEPLRQNATSISKVKLYQSDSKNYLENKMLTTPLNELSDSSVNRKFFVSPTKKSEKHADNSENFTFLQKYLHSSARLSNEKEMNMSVNRPIESKIKMIGVRENMPSQPMHENVSNKVVRGFISNKMIDDHKIKESLIKFSYENGDQLNPTKYEFPNYSNLEENLKNQEFSENNFKKGNGKNEEKISTINSFSSFSFHSPRKENQYLQSPSKYRYADQQMTKEPNRFLNENDYKMKYFNSIHASQNFEDKSPERYSLNSSQSEFQKYIDTRNSTELIPSYHFNIQKNNYIPVNYESNLSQFQRETPSKVTDFENEHKQTQYSTISQFSKEQKMVSKPSQSALSQLRESITGLAKTLNEGAGEKYTNKNININLNLNIFEQKSNRKK